MWDSVLRVKVAGVLSHGHGAHPRVQPLQLGMELVDMIREDPSLAVHLGAAGTGVRLEAEGVLVEVMPLHVRHALYCGAAK